VKVSIREIEKRDTYTYVRLGRMARPELNELTQWCKDRECGKMVNTYAISFKNEDEFTMFRLTWC
jgi:hypothetical protein